VDIDQDESAARALESLARGFRSVPTLLWPDGSLLIEPSLDELTKKMGITLP
jgi:mycoredoxin